MILLSKIAGSSTDYGARLFKVSQGAPVKFTGTMFIKVRLGTDPCVAAGFQHLFLNLNSIETLGALFVSTCIRGTS